jgi:hypothetical protein
MKNDSSLVVTDLEVDSKCRNLLGQTKQIYSCIEQIGLKLGLQIYGSTAGEDVSIVLTALAARRSGRLMTYSSKPWANSVI